MLKNTYHVDGCVLGRANRESGEPDELDLARSTTMKPPNRTCDPSRRRVLQSTGAVVGGLALGVSAIGSAAADPSNGHGLPGRIYADGRTFATRDNGDLPPPRGNNAHSYDEIYHFTNGAPGQLDVGEAAPGEQDFNGGRWSVTIVEWTINDPPVVKSDDEVHAHEAMGHINVIEEGARYFLCPVVPING